MVIWTLFSDNAKPEIALRSRERDGTKCRTLYENLIAFPDFYYPNGWKLQHRNAEIYEKNVTKKMPTSINVKFMDCPVRHLDLNPI